MNRISKFVGSSSEGAQKSTVGTMRINGNILKTHRDSTVAVARGILTAAVVLTLWVGAPNPAHAQTLVNRGFENPIPGNVVSVLDPGIVNPSFSTGYWAEESAFVTGPVTLPISITPYAGTQMLAMASNGGVTSQAWQFLDVSATVGSARTANLSAWFTADTNNAQADVALIFYSTPDYLSGGWGDPIQPATEASYTTVTTAGTWYESSLSNVAVPVGTTWVGVQLAFNNASLGAGSGYADLADFSIIPEPSTVALLAGGFGAMFFFMRRRRGTAD